MQIDTGFTFYVVMKLAMPAQAARQDACECPDVIETTAEQIKSMGSCCKIKPGEFTFNTKAAHLRAALD